MKSFEFRLDPVIRLRAHGLDRCRLELAAALGRREDALREVSALEQELRVSNGALEERLGAGIEGGTLSVALRAADQLRTRLERCERARHRSVVDVERARRRVAEAHAGLRALEHLREKRLHEYQRELSRRESREMDEVAQLVAARRGEGWT